MFLAVIAGYVIAASLAFCGVANLVHYIGAADRMGGYGPFLHGLAAELWPLAAAVVILLLIEIAFLIEKIHLYQKMLGLPGEVEAPPAPARPKRKAGSEDEGGYFRTHASAAPAATPAPAPQGKAPTRPIAQVEETPAAPQAAPTPPKQEEPGLSYFKLD